MKRYTLFLLPALLLMFITSAHAMAIKDGFMKKAWGMNVHQFPTLKKVSSTQLLDFYVDPEEHLAIGDFVLEKAIYGFRDDSLYAVYVYLHDNAAYSLMTDYIMSQYGNPGISNQGDEKIYEWQVEKVKIKIKRNRTADEHKLAFYYTPLAPLEANALRKAETPPRFRFTPTQTRTASPGDLRQF